MQNFKWPLPAQNHIPPTQISSERQSSDCLAALSKFYLLESKARKHSRKRRARVLVSRLQHAILQSRLLQLALRFFADFAFKICIRNRKKPRVARIDARASIVNARRKYFR